MSSDISTNKKARRDYEILDTYECGMELKGTEVKSIRAGKVNIADSFARVENGQMLLYGCDIQPCHSDEFPSPVTRPAYSVLDKTKIKQTFGVSVPYWTDSLKICMDNMKTIK